MQYLLYTILSIWMLLATLPFNISMHYCKGLTTNCCTTELSCCNSTNNKNFNNNKTADSIYCPVDCCSDLLITSIPKDQFKNNPTNDTKTITDFVGLINSTSSYKKQQKYFKLKTKSSYQLLVKKACAFSQYFLC